MAPSSTSLKPLKPSSSNNNLSSRNSNQMDALSNPVQKNPFEILANMNNSSNNVNNFQHSNPNLVQETFNLGNPPDNSKKRKIVINDDNPSIPYKPKYVVMEEYELSKEEEAALAKILWRLHGDP
ncbi:conserved hypothetical protein [Ricinus communis]|uniref:Uncharacterized protein n=1 Tax=Ricinus communis TaxID=3988 RepID=B9SDS3_RICCO|nr:conserved hypothetical protein [Ricinus communis]